MSNDHGHEEKAMDGWQAGLARPKTAREEAAERERSKRLEDMQAELRGGKKEPHRWKETSGDAAVSLRQQRAAEMEEIRRLKAADNREARQRLSQMGGQLTTDMESWQADQAGAKDADRKKKLEAADVLRGFHGYHARSTDAALDKAALTQAQRERMAADAARQRQQQAQRGMAGVSLGEEGGAPRPPEEAEEGTRGTEVPGGTASSGISGDAPAEDTPPQEPEPEPAPEAAPAPAQEAATPSAPELDTNAHTAASSPVRSIPPPTYSRVDIKFSFGLIVREGKDKEHATRKCMMATHDILQEHMPSAPSDSSGTGRDAAVIGAYYDPALAPTVLRIEEDAEHRVRGHTARTLVKATFPVFLKDEEARDEDGQRRRAQLLKATKSTVFKALRAAVSGGSFLTG